MAAVSRDGLIESIEHAGPDFVIGVQWHPEHAVDRDGDRIACGPRRRRDPTGRMSSPELNMRMAQARTDELRRRAATPRWTGSTGGATDPTRTVAPLTIRFADSHDRRALAALAELDSSEPLVLPALVAERQGELRAAVSMVDARVIADPFHPTVELIELLRTRGQQLAADPRLGRRDRLRGALRVARALRLVPRG